MRFHNPIWLVIAAVLLTSGCNLGQPTGGGGTGVEGLSGTLVVPTGAAATGASVKIYAETSLGKRPAAAGREGTGPLTKEAAHAVPLDSVVAAADGRFSFPALADGTYTLLATYDFNGHKFVLLLSGVVVSGQTQLGYDTLRLAGGLTVVLDADDAALADASCNLTGTPFHANVDSSDRCTMTGLPSGTFELTIAQGGISGGVVGYFLVLPGTLTDGGVRPFPSDTVPQPQPPSLIAPANAETIVAGDSLTWTAPYSGVLGYHLQITAATDSAFLAPLFDDTLSQPQHTPEGLPPGTYAWRVRALGASGPSPWSLVHTFVLTETVVHATRFEVTPSTIALWSFDSVDNLGRFPDHSGNGRSLPATEVVSSTSSYGQAVRFLSGRHISVADEDAFVTAGTPTLTYEARIWLDAYPVGLWNRVALVIGQYGGLCLFVNHQGRIQVAGQTGTEGNWQWYAPATDVGVVPLGQWVDVAVAADAAAGEQYVYVNGTPVQTYTQTRKGAGLRRLPLATYPMYPFTIGDDSQNTQLFPGRIDEIRVSNGLVLGPGLAPLFVEEPIPGVP